MKLGKKFIKKQKNKKWTIKNLFKDNNALVLINCKISNYIEKKKIFYGRNNRNKDIYRLYLKYILIYLRWMIKIIIYIIIL